MRLLSESELVNQSRDLHRQISRNYREIYSPLYRKYFNDQYIRDTDSEVLRNEVLEFSRSAPMLAIYCNIKNILIKTPNQRNLLDLYIDIGNIYRDNISNKTEMEFNYAQKFYEHAIVKASRDCFGLSGFFIGMACHNSCNLYDRPQLYGFDRDLSSQRLALEREQILDRHIIAPIEEGDRNFKEHHYTKALKYYSMEISRPYSNTTKLKSILQKAIILQHHSIKSRGNYDEAIDCYNQYIRAITSDLSRAENDRANLASACENLYSLYMYPERSLFDVAWRNQEAAANVLLSNATTLKMKIVNCLSLLVNESNTQNMSPIVSNLLTEARISSAPDLSDISLDPLLKRLPAILRSNIISSPDELISLIKLCYGSRNAGSGGDVSASSQRDLKLLSSDVLRSYQNDLPLLDQLIKDGFDITDQAKVQYSNMSYLDDNPRIVPLACTVLNPNVRISDKFLLNHFFPPRSRNDLSFIKILIKNGAVKVDVEDREFVTFVNSGFVA